MTTAYAGLGSNLRPEENLRLAVRELGKRFGPLTISPVYRNPAVGFAGDDFLNLVVAFDTELAPGALVGVFEELHDLAGRERGSARFTSRTLDIDLLLHGQAVLERPPLPRPDILEYRFVLQPLVDIAPDLRHPLSGRTLRDHLEAGDVAPADMQRLDLDLALR